MMKTVRLLLLILIATPIKAQTTGERMKATENIFFFPVEKVAILIGLEKIGIEESIDYEAVAKMQLSINTEFAIPLIDGGQGGSMGYVEDLDQSIVEYINTFSFDMVKSYLPATLLYAKKNGRNPDENYFYVVPVVSSKQQEGFIFGSRFNEALSISFVVSVRIYENRPGKEPKFIFGDSKNILIRPSTFFVESEVTSPTLLAYKKGKEKFSMKINSALDNISEYYAKKIQKKLSK